MSYTYNNVIELISYLYVDFFFAHLNEGFSKSDHHRSDSAPNVELKPLPKGT